MRLLLTLTLLAASPAFCAGWKQLFNGKDLDSWKMTGPGMFNIENGEMVTEGGMGLLYYEGAKFGNTTIRVVFKTSSERGNSGVIIRLPEKPTDPWYGVTTAMRCRSMQAATSGTALALCIPCRR